MAWRIIKQPNGYLARFSDIVEDFTHYNMTPLEAITLCMENGLTADEAKTKVESGVEDIEPWTIDTKGDGLSRWRHAIEIMQLNHSQYAVEERIKELS